jgi:hypothetical protein
VPQGERDDQGEQGWLETFFSDEARLWTRVRGAFALEPDVYAEIDRDPGSIPQAFVAVIGSAAIAGLSWSPYLMFMAIAGLLFAWLIAAALIWAVASLMLREEVDYARLLRCLGFAYVWVTPLLFSTLPLLIGSLVTLLSIALLFYSFLLATRQVLSVPLERAALTCAIATLLPIALIWSLTR